MNPLIKKIMHVTNKGWTYRSNCEALAKNFIDRQGHHFERTRPPTMERQTREQKRAYEQVPASSMLAIVLLKALFAVATILSSARAMAAPRVPIKIAVTGKQVSTRPDSPINISWSFAGPDLTGSVAYYLNNQVLPIPAQPVVGTVWEPGKLYSGPQNVAVVPGINQITVMLLTGALHNTPPPKLTDIEIGQIPSTGRGTSTSATSGIVVLAIGGAHLTPPIPPSSLTKNGLTAASRQQLMKDYAPLLLYSYDHTSDEVYAPINVLSFIKGSSLESSTQTANLPNSTLQTPSVILDPTPSSPTDPKMGTISATLSPLPAELYVTPLPNTVQKGADWATVMDSQDRNVGLYGHVILLDLKNLDVTQFQSPPDAALLAGFATRYGCDANNWASCPAQIIKIEYWQFFGYSHDFQGMGDGIVDLQTDHSGDWCTVQLYVDASWWQFGRPDAAILAVYHYMHGIQVGFDMAQVSEPFMKLMVPARANNDEGTTYFAYELHGPNHGQSVDFPVSFAGIQIGPDKSQQVANAQNNAMQLAAERLTEVIVPGPGGIPHPSPIIPSFQHPVVYVEWGGHEFWPTVGWSYTGASKHNGTGQYSYFGSSPVDLTVDNDLPPQDVALVTSFAGYWGAKGGGGPPQGPPLHCQWYWPPDTTPQELLAHVDVCTDKAPVKKTY